MKENRLNYSFKRIFYGDKQNPSWDDKVYSIWNFSALAISIYYLASNILSGISSPVMTATFIVTIVFFITSIFLDRKKKVKLRFITCTILLIFFAITWIYNGGGSSGSMQSVFLIVIIAPVLLLQGKMQWALILLNLLTMFGLLFYEYIDGHYIIQYASKETRFFDITTTILPISLALIIYIKKIMAQLSKEKEKSESLLLNILPTKIADRLKNGEVLIAERYDNVAILFADIVGFTEFCSHNESQRIVEILNMVFFAFDTKAEELQLEKIKTIGDGYMAIGSGISDNPESLLRVLDLGDFMIDFIQDFNAKHSLDFAIRIGIHIGSVTGGVIGKTKFAFDIWGDSVNIASRMESTGIPMEIHVTEEVIAFIKDKNRYKPRGFIELKGKGKLETYTIIRKQNFMA